MGMRRTITLAALATVVAVCCQIFAFSRGRDLGEDEARELVLASLDKGARRLPGLRVDASDSPDASAFLTFDVTWDNPRGSPVVGSFAVGRATADVWRLVYCQELRSKDLRRLQQQVRRRMGVSDRELRELQKAERCPL
jgi:hypothetical protein